MIAVTDAGPLIVLAKLNHLYLLSALYREVIIPRAVYREVVIEGQARGYPDARMIRSFLQNRNWEPKAPSTIPLELQQDIRLGAGEREALALAKEYQAIVLMDEVYARSIAESIGLKTVGSLGVLVEAYRKGVLSSVVLDQLLVTIEVRDDIWVHPALCERVRREVLGEG